MANRRMGSGGGFDGSYTRRPGSGNSMQSSLLGEPPGQKIQPYSINQGGGGGGYSGQGQQQFGGPAFAQQSQARQSNSFEESYSRRDKNEDFFGGGNRGSFGGTGAGRDDFGSRGGGPGPHFQPSRVPRDRGDFRASSSGDGWRQRSPSPRGGSGKHFGGSDQFGRRDGGDWGRNQFDDRQQVGSGGMQRQNQGIGTMNIPQNSNMNQGSGSGQPVVMVVPQGNSGAGGIMGMVQATQNPFNVVQRQQPMQVIVGNLPAFNADFGQQILAAASARPLGQGMMGGPQMGLMNQQRQHPQQQQQQQFNRYDLSVAEGGGNRPNNGTGRFSRPSNNQRSSSGRSALNRRSDNASGSVNKIARNAASSATLRGNRKRVILRDRHGAVDEVERKRPRTNLAQNKARNALNKAKGGKANNKKKAANKEANDKELKKDGVKEEVKGTESKQDEKQPAEGDEDAAMKEENDEEAGTKEGDDKEKKKSKYDDVPVSFLVCKICQKVMSDGASFESHLNGRAHAALVKILEGRFQKRAELLMFESKLGEEEIGIERERQRRAGKSGHTGKGSKNFCKMCDCNYSVNWGTHKVSMGHRILKEYLHPSCRFCNNNFVHRMDWVNHLYSLPHLRKLAELKEQGTDLEEQECSLQNELFCINLELGKDERPCHILNIRSQDYKQPLKEDLKEMLKNDKGELVLPEGEIEIPKEYEENKIYGEEAVLNVEGACCKVCRVYIANRNDIDAHLKSKPHFGMYVSHLKKIVKYRENLKNEAERKAKEEAERIEKEAKATAEAAIKAEEALKVEENKSKDEEEGESGGKADKVESAMETDKPVQSEASTDVEMTEVDRAPAIKGNQANVSELKNEKKENTEEDKVDSLSSVPAKEDPLKQPAVVLSTPQLAASYPAKSAAAPASTKPTDSPRPAKPAEGATPTKPADISLPATLADTSLPTTPADTSLPATPADTSLPATPADTSSLAKPTDTSKTAIPSSALTQEASGAKQAAQQQPRGGGQQGRGRGAGGARGNRGGGTPVARGGGGRGRGNSPQRGGGTPRGGGGNMRGRTPARGGGDSPNWRNRGGRGGRGFQR